MCCMFSTESIGDDKKWIWGTARVEASECEESQRNVLKELLIGIESEVETFSFLLIQTGQTQVNISLCQTTQGGEKGKRLWWTGV